MNPALRLCVTAGVALVGASAIAVTPVTAPLPDVHVPDVQLTADEAQITLDLVRHAETVGGNGDVVGPLPGSPLDETGQDQAQAVANILAQQGPFAGLYAAEGTRMIQTADPLADLLGMNVQILPGLDEIEGGIYAGQPLSGPDGILYTLTVFAWALGLEFVPLPGSNAINGVAFNDSFSDAVQTIYDNTVAGNGPTTDVAFSGEAAISTWALMNAKNPDVSTFIPLLLDQLSGKQEFLPNTGEVVLQGDPEDGWTLVSFNGHAIPQDPGLLTELIVDVRSLVTAPQTAAWHVWEAILGGDPTTIANAIQTGFSDVGAALIQFPQSVFNDIIGAFGDGAGAAGTATGEALGDALASVI